MGLTDEEVTRLRKLVGMLGSQHDGEKLAALRKIEALAASKGLHVHELLLDPPAPKPEPERPRQQQRPHSSAETIWRAADWRERLQFLLNEAWTDRSLLTEWEEDFAESVLERDFRQPTPKQAAVLDRMFTRYEARMRWRR